MQVYLASPNTQQQAEHCEEMPVLLSFACFSKWLYQYQSSFSRILIDSGAFSEFNSGKKIDLIAYKEWSSQWIRHADAIAGLDDISGNYQQGLKNLAQIEWTFPTWHDTDPIEIIPELVSIAKERNKWIGIGLKPPRHNAEKLLRQVLDLIPEEIHVHGWALRSYSYIRRFDSFDSTNWWRDAMKLRTLPDTRHLTYGECLEIIVKRYKRENREIIDRTKVSEQVGLFYV